MSTPIVRVLLLEGGPGAAGSDGVRAQLDAHPTRFVVGTADDVAAATAALSAERYDCLVLDLAHVDLTQDLQVLRAADPAVAVVVVSGEQDEAATVDALEHGVEECLTRGHLDPVLAARGVVLAIARKRAEAARVRHALLDPLTQMPNRLAIEEHLAIALQRAERRGTRIALVFVDLDGIEAIEAAHGRPAADEVLVAAGERLREVARESDAVGRLDGGTFVVVCEDLALEVSVRRLATRIEEVLSQPVATGSSMLHVAARLGFAAGGPAQTPAQLLRRLPGTAVGLAFGP